MCEGIKTQECYSHILLICKQVSLVQSVCSNWCTVLKSFMKILFLPLEYFNRGTHVNNNTSGYITNECVLRGTECGEWEVSCSDGKYTLR